MDRERFFSQHPLSWPSPPPEISWASADPPSSDAAAAAAAHFESALSSIVSSPSSSGHPLPSDPFAIRELIGRLGTICGSSASPSPSAAGYATPLTSPPKLNLSIDHGYRLPPAIPSPDAAFAERAVWLSCFGSGGGTLEQGKLSRVSSSKSMRAGGGGGGLQTPSADQELGNAVEDSSGSDPISVAESNARKRKAGPKGKAKMEEEDNSTPKRSRSVENTGDFSRNSADLKPEQQNASSSSSKKGKEKDTKPPETPKQDYIHVRARRGQATDRHSLAERVRREKISERMKLLQDLVPGCNKIIGKAVMLDEIINYVQSLQRQVEFLSMKLATLNPHIDLSMENLLQKDIHETCGPLSNSVNMLEASAGFSFSHQQQQGFPFQCIEPSGVEGNQLGFSLPSRALCMQLGSFDGLGDAATQHSSFLENDLQSFVQMGFTQNPESALSSQSFQGQSPSTHMKIEH